MKTLRDLYASSLPMMIASRERYLGENLEGPILKEANRAVVWGLGVSVIILILVLLIILSAFGGMEGSKVTKTSQAMQCAF